MTIGIDAAIRAALDAAAPGPALLRAWGVRSGADSPALVIAAGKASVAMASTLVSARLVPVVAGVVLKQPGVLTPQVLLGQTWRVFEVDHPLPSQRNLIAAQAVADAVRRAAAARTPVVVLLSGGASAHLTLPALGLSLADIRTVTDLLLRSGAPIEELNAVRKRCERLKGGGLARLAAPAPVSAYILSDVLGDRLDTIASGPTVDDPDPKERALDVLDRRLSGVIAEAVVRILAHIAKAGPLPPITNARNRVIASNTESVRAAAGALRDTGLIVETRLGVTGEARERGDAFASELLGRSQASGGRPVGLVWGGETTVTVRGQGFGGRNQEAALAAAGVIVGRPGVVIACLATDGIDGTTPPGQPSHAGARVDGRTSLAAEAAGLNIGAGLDRSDSYGLCAAMGIALRIGPTGTNVNDVWIGVAT